MIRLFAALIIFTGLTACGDTQLDVRSGAQGEVCFSDLDCREALLCTEEKCTAEEGEAPPRQFLELCEDPADLPAGAVVVTAVSPIPGRVGEQVGMCVTASADSETPDGTRVAFFERACDEDALSGLRFDGQPENDDCGKTSQTILDGSASVAFECTEAGSFDVFIAIETLQRFDLVQIDCVP